MSQRDVSFERAARILNAMIAACRATVLSLLLCSALALAADGARLPDDPRLASVHPALVSLVDQLDASGIPSDAVVGKVREGLAKNVAPDRILNVAQRLADALREAQAVVSARRPGPPDHLLVRALAEARLGGVELAAVEPLLAARIPGPSVARGVDVVVDLTLRGYTPSRAALVVRDVLRVDPEALPRLVARIEGLRRSQALSPLDALDAVGRGVAAGGSLEVGAARAADDVQRGGPAGGGPAHGRDADHGRDPVGGSGKGKGKVK